MIIVVLNIPLALLGSIVILNLTGNTINIMTLGGLALAIGILVDEATVEIENIHTQMEHTPSMSRSVRQGNMETAVPRLLALLCILSVFIPSFIMQGAVRALFVPLSLAVGGAMITSYLLSSTFVPVLSRLAAREPAWNARPRRRAEARPGFFVRMQNRFEGVVDWTVAHRRKVVLAYLLATGAVVVVVGGQLGRELFPRVDTGQFQLRVRPPQGTQFELTTRVAQKTLDVIAEEVGPETSTSRWATPAATRRSSRSTWPTSGAADPMTACSASACAKGAESISSSCRSGCARSCPRRWARGSARSS